MPRTVTLRGWYWLNGKGYDWEGHDGHNFTLQTNLEYERMNSSLDLYLKVAKDGQLFSCRGRAFQSLGAICFMDLVSEWLTKTSLFTPLVK